MISRLVEFTRQLFDDDVLVWCVGCREQTVLQGADYVQLRSAGSKWRIVGHCQKGHQTSTFCTSAASGR